MPGLSQPPRNGGNVPNRRQRAPGAARTDHARASAHSNQAHLRKLLYLFLQARRGGRRSINPAIGRVRVLRSSDQHSDYAELTPRETVDRPAHPVRVCGAHIFVRRHDREHGRQMPDLSFLIAIRNMKEHAFQNFVRIGNSASVRDEESVRSSTRAGGDKFACIRGNDVAGGLDPCLRSMRKRALKDFRSDHLQAARDSHSRHRPSDCGYWTTYERDRATRRSANQIPAPFNDGAHTVTIVLR